MPICGKCGADNPDYAVYCGTCSSSLDNARTRYTATKRREFLEPESDLGFAGSLLIIAGIFAFVQSGIFLLASPFWFWTETSLFFCGTLEMVLGTIAVCGGLSTIRRTKYLLSVAGAVAAIISVGIVISSTLGGITLVMILSSRGDFKG